MSSIAKQALGVAVGLSDSSVGAVAAIAALAATLFRPKINIHNLP